MTTLTEKIWRTFNLSDIFSIRATSSGIDKNKLKFEDGEFPYITRTDRNNGIQYFVCEQPDYKLDEGNCITVGLDTQTAFYQPTAFYTGQNIQILRNERLNKYVAQFILPCLKKTLSVFSWGGNGATLTRLRRSKIQLPVNDDGAPDFDFMENYMRDVEAKQLQRYRTYAEEKLAELESKKIPPLNQKIWQPFNVGELFRLETGKSKGLNHLEQDVSGIPYLGATNRNNGVVAFVKPVENLIQRGNCIAFIRNGEGSVGYSIYKREDFIATSDITCGYADFLNEYIGMFITTVADKVRGKYNFNYKRSDTRLKSERLMLPVNNDGAPDFEYMEAYVKNLEADKYRKYLETSFLS